MGRHVAAGRRVRRAVSQTTGVRVDSRCGCTVVTAMAQRRAGCMRSVGSDARDQVGQRFGLRTRGWPRRWCVRPGHAWGVIELPSGSLVGWTLVLGIAAALAAARTIVAASTHPADRPPGSAMTTRPPAGSNAPTHTNTHPTDAAVGNLLDAPRGPSAGITVSPLTPVTLGEHDGHHHHRPHQRWRADRHRSRRRERRPRRPRRLPRHRLADAQSAVTAPPPTSSWPTHPTRQAYRSPMTSPRHCQARNRRWWLPRYSRSW